MTSERKQSSSLLSTIAAAAIIPLANSSAASEHEKHLEEKDEQQMMYAVRMTYLDTTDAARPDSLFLTRKRAQKLAHHQDNVKVPVRRIDVGAPVARKVNPITTLSSSPTVARRKSKTPADDCHRTWEPKFQAGCHFWQCVETSECRTTAPPEVASLHEQETANCDEDEDEDDPPFPDCFAFLDKRAAT